MHKKVVKINVPSGNTLGVFGSTSCLFCPCRQVLLETAELHEEGQKISESLVCFELFDRSTRREEKEEEGGRGGATLLGSCLGGALS